MLANPNKYIFVGSKQKEIIKLMKLLKVDCDLYYKTEKLLNFYDTPLPTGRQALLPFVEGN
jgi:hypothetical protein